MPDLTVRLLGGGDCLVDHGRSGAALHTAKSPLYGGSGLSFSSTDLLAAALATCIATDLEGVAQREGISLDRIRVEAEKRLSAAPKRVEAISVRVVIAQPVEELTLVKLRRAAASCLVGKALHPDVECRTEVVSAPAGST